MKLRLFFRHCYGRSSIRIRKQRRRKGNSHEISVLIISIDGFKFRRGSDLDFILSNQTGDFEAVYITPVNNKDWTETC
jgi:hypothetical protein